MLVKNDEFLRSVSNKQVSLIGQKAARTTLHALTTRRTTAVDNRGRKGEAVGVFEFPMALIIDGIDHLTHLPSRMLSYRLNREIGYPRLEAMRHSSPATGLEVAKLVLSHEIQT